MSKMRKLIFWMSVIISLNIFAESPNGDAYLRAFNHIKADNPTITIALSDSIYDLDWFWFDDKVDSITCSMLSQYRQLKGFIYEDPQYCEILNKISTIISHQQAIKLSTFQHHT